MICCVAKKLKFSLSPLKKKLNCTPKTTKTPKKNRIDRFTDLRICSKIGLTWKQRKELKSELIKINKDAFAGTNETFELLKEYSKIACIEEKSIILLENVFNGKMYICVSGDKSASTTKLEFFIVNVISPNSSRNFTPIAIYHGNNSKKKLYEKLSQVSNLINRIHHITIDSETTKEIIVFVVGDLKLINGIYDLKSCASSFPCCYCEISKDKLSNESGKYLVLFIQL